MGNINWYPGHMKKTREMIQSNLKLVDIIIEILDARIPNSSKNPIINEITANKKRIILLNKADLADKRETSEWIRLFEKEGYKAIEIDALNGRGIDKLYTILNELQAERDEKKRNSRPLRIMILGVPNVGKSSLINRLSGRKSTKTGNKPGITKGKQWITLENGMQLLDTPGILWPKFEEPEVGLNLAFAGSIKDEILEIQDIGLELIGFLADNYPEEFMNRYKFSGLSDDKLANMEALALKRGFILQGKRIDYERTARTVIDEFRAGKIGKITLEKA